MVRVKFFKELIFSILFSSYVSIVKTSIVFLIILFLRKYRILNKTDYVIKVNEMINEGISKDKYVETVGSTHKDLKHFQDFFYRHFYKTKYYDGMRPKA